MLINEQLSFSDKPADNRLPLFGIHKLRKAVTARRVQFYFWKYSKELFAHIRPAGYIYSSWPIAPSLKDCN